MKTVTIISNARRETQMELNDIFTYALSNGEMVEIQAIETGFQHVGTDTKAEGLKKLVDELEIENGGGTNILPTL
jgi:hypothetical protein